MSITKLLQAIILLITGIPMLQVYAQPANLVLQDTTITAIGSFVARNSIVAGPNFTIAGTGDATFVTGGFIYFRPRIAVIQGGQLRTISDPTLLDVRTLESPIPAKFSLQQNYPNPFNPSTNIRFTVKEKSHISLVVLNLLGQSVATLVNEELPAGEYEASFSPNDLASGVYVYRMATNGFIQSRGMLLLK
ncbi:T9SS type A sorting domain-containing protein [Patescibacteria group bacterium]|nr:T9SS type A sorting domain-containing protein [Patescibacteria group bacterium]